jgi:hypothetical protein
MAETFVIQFTNGTDRRTCVPPYQCPDPIFAAMKGQSLAEEVFKLPWNQETDRSKWRIVVIDEEGRRYEEPARIYS